MRFARMNAILSFGFMARSFGFIKTGVTLGGSEGHPRRLGG